VWNRAVLQDNFALRASTTVASSKLEDNLPPTEGPIDDVANALAAADARPRSVMVEDVRDGSSSAEKRRSQTVANDPTVIGDSTTTTTTTEIPKPPDRSVLEKMSKALAQQYKDPFRLLLWEAAYVFPLLHREGSDGFDPDILSMDLNVCATVYHMLHALADEAGRQAMEQAAPRFVERFLSAE
jgi:hypothetical protein